jgi:hypothetical protein
MEAAVNRRTTRSLAGMSWMAMTAVLLGGCNAPTTETAPAPPDGSTATPSAPVESQDVIPRGRQENPRFSYETEKDRRFADFLREKSGGMVRQAAVGVEREGKLRIQVERSVSPDETLPLTRSILAGARRDFPGRAFTLSVYDPHGEPILRARVDPESGVRYQVVHDEGGSNRPSGVLETGGGSKADPLARSGRTEADRKFADWAEDHGRRYLRYVQADLEQNGRLWFGVTRDVKPADVPELTRSLLEGAHREFPSKALVATVFDPDGERIGRAHLGSDGRIQWEQ